jgi:hypothetical protein
MKLLIIFLAMTEIMVVVDSYCSKLILMMYH